MANRALARAALAGLPLLAVLVLWLAPRGARACSCLMPPPPADALAEADAVFEARPYSRTNDDRRAHYGFEVDRVWKGDIGPRVEISTALNSAACGRTYRVGTQYVIYASRNSKGEWTDGLCSRTRASDNAAEDLQVLGVGRGPGERPDAPQHEADTLPTEPPRIDAPPVEPPPTTPGRRGCAVEKPHDAGSAVALLLLGIVVAIARRRTVPSAAPPGRHRHD